MKNWNRIAAIVAIVPVFAAMPACSVEQGAEDEEGMVETLGAPDLAMEGKVELEGLSANIESEDAVGLDNMDMSDEFADSTQNLVSPVHRATTDPAFPCPTCTKTTFVGAGSCRASVVPGEACTGGRYYNINAFNYENWKNCTGASLYWKTGFFTTKECRWSAPPVTCPGFCN